MKHAQFTAPRRWLDSLPRARCAPERSSETRAERRIARFLGWYPADWRARYGEEFKELVRQEIRDGRDGPLLTLNVARESAATHAARLGRRGVVALACSSVCWLPFAQGFVPLAMKLTHTAGRSWFLALYLPARDQWPAIAAMIAITLLLLATAASMTAQCKRERRAHTTR